MYRNRKGETDVRFVKPIQIYFGSTEHYKEPQWLMKAWDVVKEAERTFAMLDIQHFCTV